MREQPLYSPLYRPEQVRGFDRRACELLGIDGYALMQRAGAAGFACLRRTFPGAWRLLVLCGSGNNGGDGYVMARLAREAGMAVVLCAVGREPEPQSAAGRARADFRAAGGRIETFRETLPADCDVVIDALLGTGLDRPVTGELADAIRAVGGAGTPVFAIDVPSGLSADTGAVLGCALKARHTVSFIGRKRGLYTGAAAEYTGQLHFRDLAVPEKTFAGQLPAAVLLGSAHLAEWLRPRARTAHKGDCGHLLVIGGAPGMNGAARLAAEAGLRSGAGRVTVATHPAHAHWLNLARPELMCHAVDDSGAVRGLLEQAGVVALGPGLGRGKWSRSVWETAVDCDLPLVVDADGLNLLAEKPDDRGDWILTPHPGEAARLLGCGIAEVEADRYAAASALAERYRAVVVLKGSGSLVADPDGRPVAVCPYGNPGMATAGTGDVLTGVIAALRAQGLPPLEAACAGVLAHALAGDRAAGTRPRGMLAGDLIGRLREVLNP